jgi:hypothetical protein
MDNDVEVKMMDGDSIGIVDISDKRPTSSVVSGGDGGTRDARAVLVEQMSFRAIHCLH